MEASMKSFTCYAEKEHFEYHQGNGCGTNKEPERLDEKDGTRPKHCS